MMSGGLAKVAFLHYSAPPVIGGVENVMLAHTRLFVEAGYPTTIVAGRGEQDALPLGAELVRIPALRLRRRVRQGLTWQSLFRSRILPLLERGAA